jgi:hypothetical protein
MSAKLYLQQIDSSSSQNFSPKEATPEELVANIKQILETQDISYEFDNINVKFTLLFPNKQNDYRLDIFSNTGRYASQSTTSPLIVTKVVYGNERNITDIAMMNLLESLIKEDGEVDHNDMREFLATF